MDLKVLIIPATLGLLLAAVPARAAGTVVNCTNESTSITATTPTADFIDNGDGTVTDTRTGLVWMRCSLGQSWDGSDCSTGSANTYTWQHALQAVHDVNTSSAIDPDGDGQAGFAGYTDWRLPNQAELGSIVEERCWSPAVNQDLFPDTPPSSWFWSSSPSANGPDYAWSVDFGGGDGHAYYKGSTISVRLVRAGQ